MRLRGRERAAAWFTTSCWLGSGLDPQEGPGAARRGWSGRRPSPAPRRRTAPPAPAMGGDGPTPTQGVGRIWWKSAKKPAARVGEDGVPSVPKSVKRRTNFAVMMKFSGEKKGWMAKSRNQKSGRSHEGGGFLWEGAVPFAPRPQFAGRDVQEVAVAVIDGEEGLLRHPIGGGFNHVGGPARVAAVRLRGPLGAGLPENERKTKEI